MPDNLDTDLTSKEDTIVALASGRGGAGVAVVRLSGDEAIRILVQHFRAKAQKKWAAPTHWPAAQLVYGSVMDHDGDPVDDCMAVVMRAPASFTGEDVVEIQCHGSAAIINRIIELCLGAGARVAHPGEFSRRAFLNGKMDLTQAEALSDLIAANSESARRLALQQLRGGLSQRLREINSQLIDAAAEIEAHIDFPEEDIPALAQEQILMRMSNALDEMGRLLAGHDKARMRQEGARVILAGEPNAGKSSLFNALVGRERAIVSPHPGTTRDTLEAVLEIGGLAITLVDTAGIRNEAGEIEQIGIDRAHEEIAQADIILHLAEDNGAERPVWPGLKGAEPDRVVRLWTKRDIVDVQDSQTTAVDDAQPLEISVATGQGLAELEDVLKNRLLGSDVDSSDSEMSRVRHAQNLAHAAKATALARDGFQAGLSGDLVMVDLRDALSAIGEILGERLDEQILDRIFSTFCLGK